MALGVVVLAIVTVVQEIKVHTVYQLSEANRTGAEVSSKLNAGYSEWLLGRVYTSQYVEASVQNRPEDVLKAPDDYLQAQEHYDTALLKFNAALQLDTEGYAHPYLNELKKEVTDYYTNLDKLHSAAMVADHDKMVDLDRQANGAPAAAIDKTFNQADDYVDHVVDGQVSAVEDEASSMRFITLLVSILGLLLLVLCGWALVRSITRPLRRVMGSLRAIAAGDRTQRVEHDNDDEIGAIAVAVDQVITALDAGDAAARQAEQERVARAEQERRAIEERARLEREAAEREAERERERLAAQRQQEERERQLQLEQEKIERERLEAERARERAEAAAEAERARETARLAEETAQRVEVMRGYLAGIASGDLTRELHLTGEDNVGQMADSVRALVTSLRSSMSQIGQTAAAVASASEELSTVSIDMGRSAEDAAQRVGNVSTAADAVSANVQSVATATEEMTASIGEIARNATHASSVAAQAVEKARRATEAVQALGTSSTEISQVVQVITTIAQQTNLLALNATIESARAGEAGKGFAVVANEVKELAKETASATGEIGQLIEAIQHDSAGAAAAIAEIGQVIDTIHEIQMTIAAAVEEQTATTNEISRSVTDAAGATGGIAVDSVETSRAATATQHGAASAASAASSLAGMATDLDALLRHFTY